MLKWLLIIFAIVLILLSILNIIVIDETSFEYGQSIGIIIIWTCILVVTLGGKEYEKR